MITKEQLEVCYRIVYLDRKIKRLQGDMQADPTKWRLAGIINDCWNDLNAIELPKEIITEIEIVQKVRKRKRMPPESDRDKLNKYK